MSDDSMPAKFTLGESFTYVIMPSAARNDHQPVKPRRGSDPLAICDLLKDIVKQAGSGKSRRESRRNRTTPGSRRLLTARGLSCRKPASWSTDSGRSTRSWAAFAAKSSASESTNSFPISRSPTCRSARRHGHA